MTLTGRRRVSRFVAGHEAHQSTTAEELGRAGRDWNWTNNNASRTAELEELVACSRGGQGQRSGRVRLLQNCSSGSGTSDVI